MSITIHWWMLPVAVLVGGIWWGIKLADDPANDGFFNLGGIFAVFVIGASVLVSAAICVGRWMK